MLQCPNEINTPHLPLDSPGLLETGVESAGSCVADVEKAEVDGF